MYCVIPLTKGMDAMRFQIGAFFPTRDMPADHVAIRDWAALPDFQGPYDVNDAFHETFVTLAYIAAVTERVGLTSLVLIRCRSSSPSRSGSVVALRRCCGGRHDTARGGYRLGTPTNGRRAN
jgi:hypothetical protein